MEHHVAILLTVAPGETDFPGTAWTDPEFLKPGQSLTQFPTQGYLDIVLTCVVLLAAWLGWPRANERAARS